MRKIKIVTAERYHVFNRGVDKRLIFNDAQDKERFFACMRMFNTVEPVGSLHEVVVRKREKRTDPLVYFIAYSLQDNHFHFVLEQAVDGGISKFLKRLAGGYVWYFNNKHQRVGSLFQGPFKAKHISSNEYLLYVSAYVNRQVGDQVTNVYSSWEEYKDNGKSFCSHKHLVLNQFENPADYENYADEVLNQVKMNKSRYKLLGL